MAYPDNHAGREKYEEKEKKKNIKHFVAQSPKKKKSTTTTKEALAESQFHSYMQPTEPDHRTVPRLKIDDTLFEDGYPGTDST